MKSNGILTGLFAIEFYTKLTEQLAGVHYLGNDARATVYVYATHIAMDITAGRARSMVAVVVGLISLVIGGLALSRSAGREGSGNGRTAAIVALLLGLLGVVLSLVHLASAGDFGTGGGRAGAIVALVLALIGMSLGGRAVARARHSHSTD